VITYTIGSSDSLEAILQRAAAELIAGPISVIEFGSSEDVVRTCHSPRRWANRSVKPA